MLKARGILEKYDEEIDGESKKTFVLESGGSYDASKADELQQIQEKLKNEMVSLEMEKPRIASEYYTQEEMVQFKKPKKKRKVRKREALKADDLEAITSGDAGSGDHGSRTLKSILKSSSSKSASQDDDSMEITPLEQMDPDDVYQQETDDIALEDDDAQLELEIALQRSRRLKRKTEKTGAAKVIASLSTTVKQEPSSEEYGSIVIDSTSEFCRTLGEIPTYGTSGNREEEEEDEDEWKMDVVNETQEPQSGWELVKAQEDKKKEVTQESESNVLDDEPVVGNSVAAALQLAAKKGLLSSEGKRRVEEKFVADLPSVGVIDEEKMRGDDKDRSRGGRDYDRDRDRYGGGSRGEKEGYKPNVKLEYVDEKGRTLTPKEAFRYLSHKFHGKTPAKMKTEKRTKKILEEMAMQKMSSIDTPLNTAALLKEKQKEAQSPYLILSGGGKTLSTGASLTKGK
ncbi:predicted protein [Nematostella vectensis]|uniref:U4/U6.U5 tri-snRNP-associated protein 1 n=1 Tax=Nematostella vectensis TaxID=45351 RepID=A7SFV2_NEMVE|nr:predicted protein [Nematostella vectensis]|eukprot:XP_001629478.1 predicted protein [Nematostella vectensis]